MIFEVFIFYNISVSLFEYVIIKKKMREKIVERNIVKEDNYINFFVIK